MTLGQKILELRKKQGLSQEQLGEKVNVTRQTISNWELGETSPNPEQLKLLSKAFNVSIDELLDNDIKTVLEEKVSNTEKLAGLIIKILKVIGIALLVFIVIDVIAFIVFTLRHGTYEEKVVNNFGMQCSIEKNDYTISVGTDGYFNCVNCPKEMQKELQNDYVDFSDLKQTEKSIRQYFEEKNGICD